MDQDFQVQDLGGSPQEICVNLIYSKGDIVGDRGLFRPLICFLNVID